MNIEYLKKIMADLNDAIIVAEKLDIPVKTRSTILRALKKQMSATEGMYHYEQANANMGKVWTKAEKEELHEMMVAANIQTWHDKERLYHKLQTHFKRNKNAIKRMLNKTGDMHIMDQWWRKSYEEQRLWEEQNRPHT